MHYVLIDAALALFALLAGFFSAVWYLKHTSGSAQNNGAESLDDSQQEADANNAERASMAALQLRDLAKNVATDVGDHNTLVTSISNDLSNMADQAAVEAAVVKILTANEKLQSRLEEAEQKIQTQAEEIRTQQSDALTDSLTKLSNRRAFDQALNKNIDSFNNDRKPFSLLIFDVDHFKQFNDTHGHQAGDEVLRCVGSTLTQTVKTTDVPCRYGGEEFALIMPGTKIDSARIAAERVRKAIEAMEIEFEGKTLRVTASIGVAEMLSDDDDAILVRRSDDGVYAAKEAGRNQTYWHDGQQCLSLHSPTPEPATPITLPETSASLAHPTASTPTPASDGLPSKDLFSQELQRRIAESHRFGVSLSVMQISILGYAEITQEYGNAVGTLLLESVSQFIRSSLRDMDLLGQLGAGDFIIMLPGSSEKETSLVGNRVRNAIANCVIPLGSRQLRLETLHGVTDVFPDDDAQVMLDRVRVIVEQSKQILQESAV